jgi:hypothetical protein
MPGTARGPGSLQGESSTPTSACRARLIVIGSEGGGLPAPPLIDGQHPAASVANPTRFDVGNADKH